jgi:ankyrin repeat protein
MNKRDNDGWSLAHYAANRNSIDTLRMLKHLGFDFNAVDTRKMKPLHVAVTSCALESIEFLITETGGKVAPDVIDLATKHKIDPAVRVLTNYG